MNFVKKHKIISSIVILAVIAIMITTVITWGTSKPSADELPSAVIPKTMTSESSEKSTAEFVAQLKARATEANINEIYKGEVTKDAILTASGKVHGIIPISDIKSEFLLQPLSENGDSAAYLVTYFPSEVSIAEGDAVRVYGAYTGMEQVNKTRTTTAPGILGSVIEKITK